MNYLKCLTVSNISYYQACYHDKRAVRKHVIKGLCISRLPDSIGMLVGLIELDISGICNWMSPLPDSFSQLTNLKRLDIRDNHITLIPESVAGIISQLESDMSNIYEGNDRMMVGPLVFAAMSAKDVSLAGTPFFSDSPTSAVGLLKDFTIEDEDDSNVLCYCRLDLEKVCFSLNRRCRNVWGDGILIATIDVLIERQTDTRQSYHELPQMFNSFEYIILSSLLS